MAIEFHCACGKQLKAPDGSAGRKARCPRCSTVVEVPGASDATVTQQPAQENGWMYSLNVAFIVLVPMILHGLYDTLLKKDHEVLALLVGVGSFGWLVYQIERSRKENPILETAMA